MSCVLCCGAVLLLVRRRALLLLLLLPLLRRCCCYARRVLLGTAATLLPLPLLYRCCCYTRRCTAVLLLRPPSPCYYCHCNYCYCRRLTLPPRPRSRYLCARRAKTQERYNLFFGGTYVNWAERYTDITTTCFIALFYSSVFPNGYFYCAAAMAVNCTTDLYCLVRIWRQMPMLSEKLTSQARGQLVLANLLHMIFSLHMCVVFRIFFDAAHLAPHLPPLFGCQVRELALRQPVPHGRAGRRVGRGGHGRQRRAGLGAVRVHALRQNPQRIRG